MTRIISTVETAQASRYLQQLCKHWSHRFDTAFDATEGRVTLPAGTLTLAAGPSTLDMALEADDAAELPRLGEVVADHLRRFAFREDLAVAWTSPSSSSP